jgi:hypothetical protein
MESNLSNRPKVLVMHALRPTSRQTTIDHLLSFREHLPHCDVQYLHFQQPIPKELQDVSPDLFIVNYDFLNYRFTPLWPYIKNRYRNIARQSSKVVAIAQDDFWANKLLDNWCISWNVDRILTASESGWEALYPRSHKRIEIAQCLTGYVKSAREFEIVPLRDRAIDLGQRVRQMPEHLGRFGQLKAQQAVDFADFARRGGLKVDVSTNPDDAFLGGSWLQFLSNCRFTIGMKGGASLLDPYGLVHTKVVAYKAKHPLATYEEIESKCLPCQNSKQEYAAVSPRIFEAASLGTCQILPPSNYLDVLEPWKHYLPLELDMSNANQIVEAMKDLERCQVIADQAKTALVESKKFDYSNFVQIATNGFLDEQNLIQRSHWAEFCECLHNSRQVATVSPDAHDAIQNLIVYRTGIHRGSSDIRITEEVIFKYLRSINMMNWFTQQETTANRDSTFMRSTWPWRDPRDYGVESLCED